MTAGSNGAGVWTSGQGRAFLSVGQTANPQPPVIRSKLFALLVVGLAALPWGLSAAVQNIIIVAGQSNAVGAGTDAATLTHDGAADLAVRFYPDLGKGALGWRTLGPVDGHFGPEMSLARALSHAGMENLSVVKVALNGSNLYEDWEKGNDKGAGLYQHLIDRVREARQQLRARGDIVVVRGMFWMQGETDAKSAKTDDGVGMAPPPQPGTAQNYGKNLAAFIQNVRTDLGVPELPVIIARLGPIGEGPKHLTGRGYYGYLETVQQEQVAVAKADPLVDWVDTSDLPLIQDHLHFTSAGMETLGNRFADAFLRMTRKQPQ